MHESLVGPYVWTGRALQAESDDLEVVGLALLYPALDGTFEFLAIMDIRARSISFASRPRRPYGPSDHERAGETFPPSPHFDSQTSAGKQLLLSGSAGPVPSDPPSLARQIGRATGRQGAAAIPLVNLSVFISGCCLCDARLIAALLRQHGPGDPCQLVGEGRS